MTPTTIRASGNGQLRSADGLEGRLAPGVARKKRSWPRFGAAAALALLCGAIFALLYGSAGSRHPFLAVARPIAMGETITAADLVTARIPNDPTLSPISSDNVTSVIGRHAAVSLVPGTLLTAGDLATGPLLGAGDASVGLDLKPGEAPSNLLPGDSVLVVETTGSDESSSLVANGPIVLAAQATVLSVAYPSASGASTDTDVTLSVPADAAAEIASASAAGDVALAGLVPSGAQ